MLPRPYDVPWAEEVTTENLEDLLDGASPSCGARAQMHNVFDAAYGGVPGVPVFQLVTCGRSLGHSRPHLSPGGHVPYHRQMRYT